jgi:23S rRNA (adenine2503-C2)-methyltransferase
MNQIKDKKEIKKNIYSYTLKEFEYILKPKFRAKQIYNWLYKKQITNLNQMVNIGSNIIKILGNNYDIAILKQINKQISNDGSIKYLFELRDKKTIEAVFLKMKDVQKDEDGNIIKQAQYTFCISSQVGCKIKCSFCATGKAGFTRNLDAGEIIAQIVYLKKDNELAENKAMNIVYMGMGEPLDNYDNVVKSIKISQEKLGLNISPHRQTLSTSGVVDKIDALSRENLGINLAISLHAVSDELRNELIPINRKYNIQALIKQIKAYPLEKRQKIFFEYLVIKDKNDSLEDAKQLVKLLSNIPSKVNLIYFNPSGNINYARPSIKNVEAFKDYLNKKGLRATIRESKGLDIDGACGQLNEKYQ